MIVGLPGDVARDAVGVGRLHDDGLAISCRGQVDRVGKARMLASPPWVRRERRFGLEAAGFWSAGVRRPAGQDVTR